MHVEQFLALETQVWETLVTGDPETSAHLIAEDFLGVYDIGFFDGDSRAAVLAHGPFVAAFELHDARLIVLSDDNVLLCYRAMTRGVGTDDSTPLATTYISSLWARRGDDWLNVFSQDTAAR